MKLSDREINPDNIKLGDTPEQQAEFQREYARTRAEHDARIAIEGPGDVFDLSDEDAEIFERMNRMTDSEYDEAAAEGQRLFEQEGSAK